MDTPQQLPSPIEENQNFLRSGEQDDFLKQQHELFKLQQHQWELQWHELNQ